MFFFNKKPKAGQVYLAESTRPDGSKQIYTGITRRSLWTRWREHMRGNGGKWTSRGSWFRPLAGFWSRNPRKAERTIKSWPSYRKRSFARFISNRYRNKRSNSIFD